MTSKKTILTMAAIGGLAYAGGRAGLSPGIEAIAAPVTAGVTAEMQDYGDPEWMAAQMKAGMPGPNHRHLDDLDGEWNADFKMWLSPDQEPIPSKGVVRRAWVLNGRYMHETIDAQSPWGAYSGIGYHAYNNTTGRYEIIWMDSHSTSIGRAEGSYNPATKVFTFLGQKRDASGKVWPIRSIIDLGDAERQVYTEYMTGADGVEQKIMEGVTTRRTANASTTR